MKAELPSSDHSGEGSFAGKEQAQLDLSWKTWYNKKHLEPMAMKHCFRSIGCRTRNLSFPYVERTGSAMPAVSNPKEAGP